MAILENIGYILIGFVIIIAAFLIILTMLEKKLHIRFLRGRTTPNEEYIKKLTKINIKNSAKALKELSKIAKAFFKEAFHIKGAPEFSQLQAIFEKRNNRKAENFSEEMTELMYSGKKPSKTQVQDLIKLLAEIIGSNRILTKEEKKELDKKSQEKNLKMQKKPIINKFFKKKKGKKK